MDASPLQPVLLRLLDVDPAAHPRGQPHLSAASGLARAGRFLYLVADDEHHLGVLDLDALHAPVRLHRIRSGDLPQDAAARKRVKPDLECLLYLAATREAPHGALLALGSGSTVRRERTFLLPLDAAGRIAGTAREIDCADLYAPLRALFADLNIEGAFLADGALHLLQRANTASAANACIRFDASEFHDWLQGATPAAPRPRAVIPVDLGTSEGIPFGLTDAIPWPGRGWIFSAVAEDTNDSYADGRCAAAAVGWATAAGEVRAMRLLAGAPKVEGIALVDGCLLLVTDADDPASASRLLQLDWPPA
jgi:hypothetical protein